VSHHPYPDKIRLAVAETIAKQVLVMREWADLTAQTRDAFLGDADQVLNTLWDASRVEVDRIGELPENTAFIDGDGFIASSVSHAESNWMENPVYAIYWGDSGD
jgi:hypothetical protein